MIRVLLAVLLAAGAALAALTLPVIAAAVIAALAVLLGAVLFSQESSAVPAPLTTAEEEVRHKLILEGQYNELLK